MTKKELQQYKHIKERVEITYQTWEALKFEITLMKQVMSDMPRTANKKRTEAMIAEKEAMAERYINEHRRADYKRGKILDYIESIEDEEMKNIIHMYYIDGMTWETIAERLNYSVDGIHRKVRKFHAKGV